MPRKEKEYKYHFIYRTTNIKNGKFYIGMHSTDNLDDGYLGSGKRLRNSIRAHGKDVHVREILEFHIDRKSLVLREKEIVNMNLLNDIMCINLMEGGNGGLIDNSHREKFLKGGTLAMKEKWKEESFRNKQKELLSNSLSKRWKTDERDLFLKASREGFKNKKHTKESKEKISGSLKNKQNGDKNSQYGKKWIFNKEEGIERKVGIEEIEKYFNLGWEYGRNKELFVRGS